MSRKQDERALFSGTITTDINLESKTHLNLNLNEPIIEVQSFYQFSGIVEVLLPLHMSRDTPSFNMTQVVHAHGHSCLS